MIQAANSEVTLYTPKGIRGAILANIHTNHDRFLKHISEQECLVSPICEYFLYPYPKSDTTKDMENACTSLSKDHLYLIQVPHVIEDVYKKEEHIRVKHGNIHSAKPPLAVEQSSNSEQPDQVSFTVDPKYVNIYTNHFSGFIVTVEAINCCSESAYALMFGSLKKCPKEDPLVSLKVYLSNKLVKIQDYNWVSETQVAFK